MMTDKTVLFGAMASLAFGPRSVTTFGINPNRAGPPPFGSFAGAGSSNRQRPDFHYRDPFHDDYAPENHFFYDFEFMEGEVDNLDYVSQDEMFQRTEALYDRLRGRPGPGPGRHVGAGPHAPPPPEVRTFDRGQPLPQDLPHPFRTASRSPATYSITRPGSDDDSSSESNIRVNNNKRPNSIQSIRTRREPSVQSIWETSAPTVMDGNTMETWAFPTPDLERVQVLLKSSQPGCPLHATIDLWHGPENTPCKMAVYCLNEGSGVGQQPATFSAILETPRGQNTVAVKNIANMDEAPMMACVEAEMASGNIRSKKKDFQHDSSYHTRRPPNGGDDPAAKPLKQITQSLVNSASHVDIQSEGEAGSGRNIHTVSIPRDVCSMQVMLSTEPFRPLQARIEVAVVGGDTTDRSFSSSSSSSTRPSSKIQQVCEVHSEDGESRPLFAVLDIPPLTNVNGKSVHYEIRVVNLSTMDFPMKALVKPYAMREDGGMVKEEGNDFEMDTDSAAAVIDVEIIQ